MRCIVCGNADEFRRLSPELCATDNRLCGKCGLVFIPRTKGEKHDHYRSGGYYTSSPNLAARRLLTSRHMLLRTARARVAAMEPLLPGPLDNRSVLDVGCGYGEIIGYLQQSRGCRVLGLEPSAQTAAAGESMFGIRIVPALFGQHDLGGQRFDLAVCNHTLEHIDEPATFLAALKETLADDGVLYLEVPNIMWPSGGFTLDAFLYDEHLQTFSSWNLSLLLRRCGFAILAYSDKEFLRFVCADERRHKGIEPPFVDPEAIHAFLRRYKAQYSLVQRVRVLGRKLNYLASLSYSKIVDLVARR
jgi:SAM-dependent methyltransferase